MNLSEILPTQFTGLVNTTECRLELHLNADQRVMGRFHADPPRAPAPARAHPATRAVLKPGPF
jgi:hypothetical protein